MKRNYKITIITTQEVIERKFYKIETAIRTIIEFKKRFDDFKIGFISKKIKGEWDTICSITK